MVAQYVQSVLNQADIYVVNYYEWISFIFKQKVELKILFPETGKRK